jgi:hypothetical protein
MTREPNFEVEETDEEFLARRARQRAAKAEAAKPKLIATVSEKMAEAIKANPTSLQLRAKGADEVVEVIDRPRPTEVIQLMDEPTVDGKLTRVLRFDCATGETSVIQLVNGYRQPSGAVHVYDPFAALKENGDD